MCSHSPAITLQGLPLSLLMMHHMALSVHEHARPPQQQGRVCLLYYHRARPHMRWHTRAAEPVAAGLLSLAVPQTCALQVTGVVRIGAHTTDMLCGKPVLPITAGSGSRLPMGALVLLPCLALQGWQDLRRSAAHLQHTAMEMPHFSTVLNCL